MSIVNLSNELGYTLDPKNTLIQLDIILKDSNHCTFGAIKNELLVGLIHSFHTVGILSLPFTEIMALIVSEKERGNGIGTSLVKKIESVSINKKLRVRCNTNRLLAHKFYQNLNFILDKEQKVFEKLI